MKKNKGRRRFFIVALIVLAVLVIAAITGWNYFKYLLIKNKVSNMLYKNSNGLYTVEYDSLSVDEVAGNLAVYNLRLIPDTARYRALQDNHQPAPALLVAVTAPLLRISGVKTPKALLSKELEGGKVAINNADVVLYHSRGARDTTAASDTLSLQETLLRLLNKLHTIKADTLQVENTSLSLVDFMENEQKVKGASVSLHLYDILIDSSSVRDTSRFLFARRGDAGVQKVLVKDKKGIYHFTVDEALFNSSARSLTIKNFRIVPLLGEDATMRAAGESTDRFDFHLGTVALRNLDLPKLMTGAIYADTLFIGESSFKIYRDLSYPHSNRSMIGKYPHQALMKLPLPYRLKKVVASDVFIEYKEKNAKSDTSGKLQFDHSFVTMTGLTNIDVEISRNNDCVLNFNSRLLNMASLKATIVLQLKDPQGRFTVKGSLGGFDAPRLNVLLRPMALAQVEKGHINKLDFSLACDNYKSHGKVMLLYDDLNISVLKKDKDDNNLKEKKLASLVANMVVKNANPSKKDKEPREATVDYKRDPVRSFFNLIWKSVLTGVKENVGM